jgi:hypothetical protein
VTTSGKSDSPKRCEFWSWWLNVAVPNAWDAIEKEKNMNIALAEAS